MESELEGTAVTSIGFVWLTLPLLKPFLKVILGTSYLKVLEIRNFLYRVSK